MAGVSGVIVISLFETMFNDFFHTDRPNLPKIPEIHWIPIQSGKKPWLVGGFKHFLFSIIYRIILPIDFHIFQDG